MKNNWLNFWKAFWDRIRLKEALRPRSVFLRASKEAFLSEIKKNFSDVTIQRERRISLYIGLRRYALLTIGVIIVGNISTAVLADASDVSFDHPLYAYKRLDESVRTLLSSPAQESGVRTQLAERRLSEMQTVIAESPAPPAPLAPSKANKTAKVSSLLLTETEEKVQKLTQDLQKEVDSTLEKAKEAEKDQAELTEICDKIQDIFEEHEKLASSEHAPALNLDVFQKYCKDKGE